ncbi:MAG: hypothetical protein AAGF59_05045 [Pseudomonadota bacterium]
MSSHDHRGPRLTRRQAFSLAGIVATVPLAGCFRPLYGQGGFGGSSGVPAALRTIKVRDPSSRGEQFFYNELIFLLRGGREAEDPTHRLEYRLQERQTALSVQVLSDVPQSFILNLSAVYSLWDINEDRVVHQGSSFAESSFTFSNQRFAFQRATLDARERAAHVIADEVRTQLATFFSQNGT